MKETVTRRETLFAPPRRTVVPRPVYRHRFLVALSSRLSARAKTFSVERVQLALLSIFLFGVLGVFIADIFFCPAGTGMKFWDGCMYEVIGFGVGGGLLGLSLFLFLRSPSLVGRLKTAAVYSPIAYLKRKFSSREDR